MNSKPAIWWYFSPSLLNAWLLCSQGTKRSKGKKPKVVLLLLPAGKPRLYLRSHEVYSVLSPAGISALKTLLLILMPSSSCSYEPRAPPLTRPPPRVLKPYQSKARCLDTFVQQGNIGASKQVIHRDLLALQQRAPRAMYGTWLGWNHTVRMGQQEDEP